MTTGYANRRSFLLKNWYFLNFEECIKNVQKAINNKDDQLTKSLLSEEQDPHFGCSLGDGLAFWPEILTGTQTFGPRRTRHRNYCKVSRNSAFGSDMHRPSSLAGAWFLAFACELPFEFSTLQNRGSCFKWRRVGLLALAREVPLHSCTSQNMWSCFWWNYAQAFSRRIGASYQCICHFIEVVLIFPG